MEVEGTRNLIIIGNGFDLAHGLKTSYEDFLFNYILTSFEEALKSKHQEETGMCYKEDLLFKFRIVGNDDLEYLKSKCKCFEDLKIYFKDNSDYTKIEALTSFSRAIYGTKERWVDIEGIYYKQLNEIHKNNSLIEKRELFVQLNEEMNYLKKALEIYLDKHYGEKRPKDIMNDLFFARHLFGDEINPNGVAKFAHREKHKFYIVNFNYTITANKYRSNVYSDGEIEVNHIHGEINNRKNPIIFGYGDEKDKNYKGIEDLEIDEAFENIKSFGYLQNDNYQNLLGFISGGKFNVIIVGHSCGLSDRTLLSTIFEHPDCEKIRVCYYEKDGRNDFTNKTYQMSRHFDDKKVLRERIMSPKDYDRIPQYND